MKKTWREQKTQTFPLMGHENTYQQTDNGKLFVSFVLSNDIWRILKK